MGQVLVQFKLSGRWPSRSAKSTRKRTIILICFGLYTISIHTEAINCKCWSNIRKQELWKCWQNRPCRYSLQTKGRSPTQLELLDLVSAKLDDLTILLLGRWALPRDCWLWKLFTKGKLIHLSISSPHMEIRPDYFNRVRMNTVLGHQVAFNVKQMTIL